MSVENSFALGSGTTTLFEGGQLILNVSEVRGHVVLDGGEFVSTDDFEFAGTLVNGGELNPGASPGTLTVTGEFQQEPNGRLVMEIASPFLADSFYTQQNDLLEVTGELHLDGTLSIKTLHDFLPNPGDTFQLLNSNNITGNFVSFELPDLGPSRAWDLSQLHTTGQIAVVPEPPGFAVMGIAAFAMMWATARRRP